MQVVGPGTSETLQIPAIKTSRTTVQVPIPDAVDKEGGSFDIELGKHRALLLELLTDFWFSKYRGRLRL